MKTTEKDRHLLYTCMLSGKPYTKTYKLFKGKKDTVTFEIVNSRAYRETVEATDDMSSAEYNNALCYLSIVEYKGIAKKDMPATYLDEITIMERDILVAKFKIFVEYTNKLKEEITDQSF